MPGPTTAAASSPPAIRSTSPSRSTRTSSSPSSPEWPAGRASAAGSVPPLAVAFVTSEMTPFMKTGGLADVSAALPRALVRLGHRVMVFLPRYAAIGFPAGEFAGSVHVPVDAVHRSAGFYRRVLPDG